MKTLIATLLVFTSTLSFAQTEVDSIEHQFCMRNQGETSTCWLHSAVQMMEQAAKSQFSIDALVIHEIRSRALVRKLGHQTPWDGGAGPTRPFALALEHGLVPEEVYKAKKSLILNYEQVFQDIERILYDPYSIAEFMEKVDQIILSYIGEWPPKSFEWRGQARTTFELAQDVVGSFPSMGYDFQDVTYDDSIYGRMDDVAWTNIISGRRYEKNQLVKITEIIEKNVVKTTASQAWDLLVRKFYQEIPLALTFIWSDHEGEKVVGLNDQNEYVSIRPASVEHYTGSHLVLVTGIVKENGVPVAIEVLDPLARTREEGLRLVTRDFFSTHGKTVHEVMPACESLFR